MCLTNPHTRRTFKIKSIINGVALAKLPRDRDGAFLIKNRLVRLSDRTLQYVCIYNALAAATAIDKISRPKRYARELCANDLSAQFAQCAQCTVQPHMRCLTQKKPSSTAQIRYVVYSYMDTLCTQSTLARAAAVAASNYAYECVRYASLGPRASPQPANIQTKICAMAVIEIRFRAQHTSRKCVPIHSVDFDCKYSSHTLTAEL